MDAIEQQMPLKKVKAAPQGGDWQGPSLMHAQGRLIQEQPM